MKNGTARTYAEMIRNFKEESSSRGVEVTQEHVDALNAVFCDFVFNKISVSMISKRHQCGECKTEINRALLSLAEDLRPAQ